MDLKELGLTNEELQERVVAAVAKNLLTSYGLDEDGEEYEDTSPLRRRLETSLQGAVDAGIAALAEQFLVPNVQQFIETVTLRKTNAWGEAQGQPMTFTEYLVDRAEKYMTDEVDFQGKPPDHSTRGKQTRIAYMVDKHLQYEIQNAMAGALKTANEAIVGGIEAAVKFKLGEVLAALKTTVTCKT